MYQYSIRETFPITRCAVLAVILSLLDLHLPMQLVLALVPNITKIVS